VVSVPYPIRHKLLSVLGTTFTGADIFSFSVRIIPPIGSLTVSQAQVDALAAATSTMFASANLAVCPWNRMTAIKLAPVGTDGHYPPGEDAFEHIYSGGVAGGAVVSNIIWPPQCSYSVGLQTAALRGRGHIGRFYLPSMAFNVNTATGKVGDLAGSAGAVLRTWINAINATTDIGTVGVITSLGSGTSRVCTGIRLGQVIDTQRRRRNNISETYTSVAL
jgi:hypothetical protein